MKEDTVGPGKQWSLAEVLWVAPDQPVRVLQYEVREGGEAGEVVVLPKAFIANRNGSLILQLGGCDEVTL